MMVALVALLVGAASAADGLNSAPTFHLQVVHAVGRAHPWGVRVGAGQAYAVGHLCSQSDADCRTNQGMPGSLWALLGPGGLLAETGVASLDMHQFGFLPYWQLVAAPGLRWSREEGFMVAVGGFLAKSLSPRLFTPTTDRWELYPTEPLALRLAVGTGFRGAGAWVSPTATVGLQVTTRAADFTQY